MKNGESIDVCNKSGSSRRRFIEFFSIALLIILIKLVDLGHSDPWLDEINNWQKAEEYGMFEFSGVHPATFFFQSLGLKISDSLFGLRLYSALFGSLSILLMYIWFRVRVGGYAALIWLVLSLASPIYSFYTQDANHYAPLILSSVIGLIGFDSIRFLSKKSVFVLGGTSLLAFGSTFFHLLGFEVLLLQIVALYTMMVYVFMVSDRGRKISKSHILLYSSLLPVTAAVVCAPVIIEKLALASGAPPSQGELRPGFNLDFLAALFSNYYGALFYHQTVDYLLAVVGILLTVTGIIAGLSNESYRWISIGALLTFLLGTFSFIALPLGRYFAARYIIVVLPVLLFGICILIDYVMHGKHLARYIRIAAITILACWSGLFLYRAFQWKYNLTKNPHQPSIKALEYAMSELPEDAKFLTFHRYSARALHFLLTKKYGEDIAEKKLLPIQYVPEAPKMMVYQARRLQSLSNSPIYYMSLIESEERYIEALNSWLNDQTREVRKFESGSIKEFVPLDWSVTIRKVALSDNLRGEEGLSGVEAISFLNSPRIDFKSLQESSSIYLKPGAGATYSIPANSDEVEGLSLELSTKGEDLVDGQVFDIIFGDQAGRVWSYPIKASTPKEFSVYLPISDSGTRNERYLSVYMSTGMNQSKDYDKIELGIHRLRLTPQVPEESRALVNYDEGGGSPLEWSSFSTESIPLSRSTSVNLPNLESRLSGFHGRGNKLLTQWIHPLGSGEVSLQVFVSTDGKGRYRLSVPSPYTSAPHITGIILDSRSIDTVDIKPEFRPYFQFERYTSLVKYTPVEIHIPTDSDESL